MPGKYAGQTWVPGVFSSPVWVMDVISRDLLADIQRQGVAGEIELWGHEDGRKGFFVGDMSSLSEEGWTKLATL